MSLAGTLDAAVGAVHRVGMGQLVSSREPGESLRARDLGSCIGIAVWDPVARVGGMAHVVLPEATTSSLWSPPGKYADLAVPALVRSVERLGGLPSRLVCNGTGVVRVRTVGAGTVEI